MDGLIVIDDDLRSTIRNKMYNEYPSIKPSYSIEIQQFLAYSGSSFNFNTVKSYVNSLHYRTNKQGKALKIATINKNISAIKNMVRGILEISDLTIAQKYELEMVLSRIHLEKENQNKNIISSIKVLSSDEIKILKAGSPVRTSLLVDLLYRTGCRISEVINIKHVDCTYYSNPKSYSGYYIQIHGKGRRYRQVRIKAELYKQIEKVYKGSVYLFESQSGKQLNRVNVYNEIRRLGQKHLERDINPHMFRHSFATEMISKTGKIQAVSEYLGHSTTQITLDMYCHEHLEDEELFE